MHSRASPVQPSEILWVQYGMGCRIKDRTYRAQTPATTCKSERVKIMPYSPPPPANALTCLITRILQPCEPPWSVMWTRTSAETFGNAGAVREVNARDGGYWRRSLWVSRSAATSGAQRLPWARST
jgi:hypothetical protein